ncbi:MAG: sigma-70 family RNA polymerase sigma factor [Cyclobacteriaceae bacterium]
MSDQWIVGSLSEGNDEPYRAFYLREREDFIQWCFKHAKLDEQESKDLYQESQMYLYENIVGGRLENLTSSLKTYLYSIAKNQLRVRFKKMVVIQKHEENLTEHLVFLKGLEGTDPANKEKISRLAESITAMAEPCRSLLVLFYYENLRFRQIAERLGYKNESVAKNQKKRCLERLRSQFDNKD